ncbi:MAG: S41 family peptidase, partial [Gemmatimonadales bacterium]
LPDGALWIRVNSLADPAVVERFDRALGDAREGREPRGLVLDLRETSWTPGGGRGREHGYAILARLIDRPFLTSSWRTPQYRDRAAFTGPVAVLASPRTAGPAEDLLVAFRNGSRGPIIGEPSAGSTGQTAILPLARDWRLRVTVTRDAFPDGTEFMPTGIAPELTVGVRVEDVLAGRDAVLERARTYLAARHR